MPTSRSSAFRRRLLPAGAALSLVASVTALALAVGSSPSAAAATAVDLGTAGSFGVLAGSTVTNTGPSVISGDLGVSPGNEVTGFPPGTVLGTTHAANAEALQAQEDLTIAYNNLFGQASDETITADLGGRTLTTGVYTSASTMGLTGELTLDAQGDPTAVFIFQVGSGLTIASGSDVTLTNGAQACNVYWQVGSSAVLRTGSSFIGTIVALTSISLETGATVDGRVLARNGAVTLDDNTITPSACTTPDDGPETDGPETDGPETDNPSDDNPSDVEGPSIPSLAGQQVSTVPQGGVDTGDGASVSGSSLAFLGGGFLALVLAGGLFIRWRQEIAKE